jgi:hypothetical protein
MLRTAARVAVVVAAVDTLVGAFGPPVISLLATLPALGALGHGRIVVMR